MRSRADSASRAGVLAVELVSIEVSDRCSKGCAFCYAGSSPTGTSAWTEDDLVTFVADLARSGVAGVSFGGGEPLELPWLFALLGRTRGMLHRSLTTNGLLLDTARAALLAEAAIDAVQVSVHFPEDEAEVARTIEALHLLRSAGIAAGVNLLVRSGGAEAARAARGALAEAGVDSGRVVLLPMRLTERPALVEIVEASGEAAFQSMSCLLGCAASPRFCSVSADRTVGRCSYTRSRARLGRPTYAALVEALAHAGHTSCGEPIRVQRARTPLAVLPAAHSMDTDWFAVDEDGHVAELSSGERGAVPLSFQARAGDEFWAEPMYLAALRDPSSGLRIEVGDLLVEPDHRLYSESDEGTIEPFDDARENRWCSYLVWLADEGLLAALDGHLTRITTGTPDVVAYGEIDDGAIRRRLLGSKGFLKGWADFSLRGERLGLFSYDHDDFLAYAPSAPYRRLGVPARPIRVDQLRGEIREIVSATRLAGVRFADEAELQPIEHAPCGSHQSAFIPAYQTVVLPFEPGRVPRFPRGRPGVHTFLAAGLEALSPTARPGGPFHAGRPIPRIEGPDTLHVWLWLVRQVAHAAPKHAVAAGIAERFERLVTAREHGARRGRRGRRAADVTGGPAVLLARAEGAPSSATEAAFVSLLRQAAAASVDAARSNLPRAAARLVFATGQAAVLAAGGALRRAGLPSATTFLDAFDQELLRVELSSEARRWRRG